MSGNAALMKQAAGQATTPSQAMPTVSSVGAAGSHQSQSQSQSSQQESAVLIPAAGMLEGVPVGLVYDQVSGHCYDSATGWNSLQISRLLVA
jgi:hypothetical protein